VFTGSVGQIYGLSVVVIYSLTEYVDRHISVKFTYFSSVQFTNKGTVNAAMSKHHPIFCSFIHQSSNTSMHNFRYHTNDKYPKKHAQV
jgi:hypothetical protein